MTADTHTFEGDARFWADNWERFSFTIRDGEDVGRLALRLWSERCFDAWIERISRELREARRG